MSERYCLATTIMAGEGNPGLDDAFKAAATWVSDQYGDGFQFGSIFHVEVSNDEYAGWAITIYHDGSNKRAEGQ